MAEDPNTLNENASEFYSPTLSSFVAAGNVPEMKSQLMQFKFVHDFIRDMFKQQGSPVVVNAEQFRGTIKLTDKPKVTLYFLQKPEEVKEGFTQIHADVGFRLVDKPTDPELWTDEMYKTLGERIQNKFAEPIFSFEKGKELLTYFDTLKGYSSIIWCKNKAEGHRLQEQVMDIQDHSYDLVFENHKTNSSPNEKYPDVPEKKSIRGRPKRKRRVGAVGTVWFRFAFLTFPAFNDTVMLVDTTGSKVDPVLLQSPQILNYNVGLRQYTKATSN